MRSRLRLLLGLSLPVMTGCPDPGGAETDTDTDGPTGGSDTTMGPSSNTVTESETDTVTVTVTATDTDTVTETADTTSGDAVCGDGIVEGDEQCDDGNTEPGDNCDEQCQVEEIPEECGDGNIDPGEECDDGNNEPNDGCSPICELEMPEACGNGELDPGEECDDGNNEPDDGCSPTCQEEISASCGDGIVDKGEECDDGNAADDDACLSTCVSATCGDGIVWTGTETCDDGNTTDGDDCSSECISELCGNGVIDLAEQCDEGGANGTPGNDCFETCILIDADFDMPFIVDIDLGNEGVGPIHIETGDFNGDGRLDLATVNQDSADTTVLYGFGDGRFWAPHRRIAESQTQDVELADLNGDGRLDAIVANENSDSVTVFLGDGAAFAAGTNISVQFAGVGFDPRGLAVADLNGDGDLDVVTANQDSNSISILTGDGAGNLTATASMGTFVGMEGMGPTDVKVADVNDDGELDIVTVNETSDDVTLFLGLGAGNFAAASTFTTRIGAGGDDPVALQLADVTGDMVPDAIVAAPTSDDVVVLVSDPTADGFEIPVRFITLVGADGGSPSGLAVGDVTNDGEPDVVTANFSTDDVTVLVGVGGGATFDPPVVYPTNNADVSGFAGDGPRGIRLMDLNDDGWLDIITSNITSDDISVLLNDGTGLFEPPMNFESSTGYSGFNPQALAMGDVNGDGLLDAVVSNRDSGDMTVVPGLGEGLLAPAQTVNLTGSTPHGVALGDLNGDGRLDWAATQTFSNTMRRAHQGIGGQFFTTDYFVDDGPRGIDLGDLDGDGDLDSITATFDDNEISRVLNTGTGTFGSVSSFFSGGGTRAVAVFDVTGDGALDAVNVATASNVVYVHAGNGGGSFSAGSSFTTAQSTSGQEPWHLAIEDLTGDSLPDIVTANSDSNDVSLLTNAGGGIFMDPVIIPVTFDAGDALTQGVRVGDFDNDGLLDLGTVNRGRNTVSIIFGFGGGSFSAPQEFDVGLEPTQLAVGDFNGDGYEDIATVNYGDDTVSIRLSQGH